MTILYCEKWRSNTHVNSMRTFDDEVKAKQYAKERKPHKEGGQHLYELFPDKPPRKIELS